MKPKNNFKQEIVWLLNEKYKSKLTNRAKKDITCLEKGLLPHHNGKKSAKRGFRARGSVAVWCGGEPIDYVIGYKNFCGCKIDLRYKPLIPREETETWVKKVIEDTLAKGWGNAFCDTLAFPSEKLAPRLHTGQFYGSAGASPKLPVKANQFGFNLGKISPKANQAILPADAHKKHFPSPCLKVLDIFAGSGCIGIAVLKNVPNSHCDFADIDENCLKQIRLNLKINGIDKKRYRVVKSDVFEKIKGKACPERAKRAEGYDVILANPPYIALKAKSKVQKSVLDFEPKKALFAKDSGLFFTKKFLQEARNYLAPQGVIYLEFGYNQKKDIEKLLKKFKYQNCVFNKDQFGKWRFAVVSV